MMNQFFSSVVCTIVSEMPYFGRFMADLPEAKITLCHEVADKRLRIDAYLVLVTQTKLVSEFAFSGLSSPCS